jgi:hypothetical protein
VLVIRADFTILAIKIVGTLVQAAIYSAVRCGAVRCGAANSFLDC